MPSEPTSERLLRQEDITTALKLSADAGWNQTEEDWQTLLDLASDSCWGIEMDGTLVATTTLLRYGRRLGWIGMVLTDQKYRRRGLAKTLLERVLAQADKLAVETIKLDATDQGLPLYEQFGFRAEQEIERWSRPATASGKDAPAKSRPGGQEEDGAWRKSDAAVFGADRTQLLETLARENSPISRSRSYIFFRKGRATKHLGPCVSESSPIARSLIEEAVRASSSSWSWDLLPRNAEAVAIARDLGFTPQRHLVRMTRGRNLRANGNKIYATAGFELG
jgi:GNAT superfamily N-acetyltransferase